MAAPRIRDERGRFAQLQLRLAEIVDAHSRPTIRAECASQPYPCTETRCRYNLQHEDEGAKLARQPEHRATIVGCVLDIVDREPRIRTQPEVAAIMGVSPQRVQQVEASAIRRLRHWCRAHGVAFEAFCEAVGFHEDPEIGKNDVSVLKRYLKQRKREVPRLRFKRSHFPRGEDPQRVESNKEGTP